MKKNYNPYTVPEGFFEQRGSEAVAGMCRKRRTLRIALLSAASAVLIAVPLFTLRQAETVETPEEEVMANSLASMYDYDIFLQVSF